MPGTYPRSLNGSQSSTPSCMSGYLNKNYLYGYHTRWNGHTYAVQYDYANDTYKQIQMSTIAGNTMEEPNVDPTDDHYSYAVGAGVGASNNDVVFYMGNHHDNVAVNPTSPHIIQCNNVNDFDNPASWAAGSTTHFAGLDSDPNWSTYTYQHFCRRANGTLLHFFSQSEAASVSRGRDYLGFKYINGVWTAIVSDGHFATTNSVANGTAPGDEANRVYVNAVYVDQNDRVHITGIWRYADEDATSQNKPWYLYSDNLTTWYHKANGGDVARDGQSGRPSMPLTWANRSGAEITGTPATSHSARNSLYVDPSTGYPRVIVRDQGTSNWYAFSWNGTTWVSEGPLPTQGGEHRDELFLGVRWRRRNTGNRLAYTLASDSTKTFFMGGGIKTAGENYSPTPDPCWLIDYGRLALPVGDGDTPLFWVMGGNSFRNS